MSRTGVVLALLAAALLAGLFVALRPQTASAPPAGSLLASFEIRDGQRLSGPEILRVQQGQNVTIAIRSNRPDEAHLHGYDLSAELRPDATARLVFSADLSGRFDLELHHSDRTVTTLEVLPR